LWFKFKNLLILHLNIFVSLLKCHLHPSVVNNIWIIFCVIIHFILLKYLYFRLWLFQKFLHVANCWLCFVDRGFTTCDKMNNSLFFCFLLLNLVYLLIMAFLNFIS
jgi:hypothetical protein